MPGYLKRGWPSGPCQPGMFLFAPVRDACSLYPLSTWPEGMWLWRCVHRCTLQTPPFNTSHSHRYHLVQNRTLNPAYPCTTQLHRRPRALQGRMRRASPCLCASVPQYPGSTQWDLTAASFAPLSCSISSAGVWIPCCCDVSTHWCIIETLPTNVTACHSPSQAPMLSDITGSQIHHSDINSEPIMTSASAH